MGCAGPPAAVTEPGLAAVLRAGLKSSPPALPTQHWRILNALLACRTAVLGGHRYHCLQCGRSHFVPHSCRNRHCPQCQGAAARDWLAKQEAALLPVPYFHLVFTLPHVLNPLIRQNQRVLYTLLFNSVSETLLEFGRQRFQAQLGITAVLHTWSQTLLDHYHLHCIVPGGALSEDGSKWIRARPNYLFAVRALSEVFRGKFCSGLQQLQREGQLKFCGQLEGLAQLQVFQRLLRQAVRTKWVVFAKRPFGGPQQVLAYLSRYTHRVAISARRLLSLDEQKQTVTFSWKDYAHEAQRKAMTLDLREFVRRFCLHLLPERFVKIRHYGLLNNRQRKVRVAQARALLVKLAPPATAAPASPETARTCPHCGSNKLILVEILALCVVVRPRPLDSS